MGQYVLVEKDSKVMQKGWKCLIILLLSIILVSCLLSSFSFSAMTKNFNDNCVTVAKPAFKRIPSNDEALTEVARQQAKFYGEKANQLDKEFRSYYLSKELRETDETGAVAKTQIFQFLNNRL